MEVESQNILLTLFMADIYSDKNMSILLQFIDSIISQKNSKVSWYFGH